MASQEPSTPVPLSLADIAPPVAAEAAMQALKRGPVGAYIVASIAVGLLFIGWLAFYFLLFMRRGPIG